MAGSALLSSRAGRAAVLSHFAAAAFWGFWTWEERRIDVTVPGGARDIDGIRVHRSRALGPTSWCATRSASRRRRGRCSTSLLCCRRRGCGHRAPRRGAGRRVDPPDRRTCAIVHGHHGAAKLRAVIADGPAPTRTDLEDLLLDLLDRGGIQRPEINAPLRFGAETIVPDYLWRARRVAIEADSVTWHEHKLIREHDADKQAQLEAAGLRVLRITWTQITRSPQQTLARVRAALG